MNAAAGGDGAMVDPAAACAATVYAALASGAAVALAAGAGAALDCWRRARARGRGADAPLSAVVVGREPAAPKPKMD